MQSNPLIMFLDAQSPTPYELRQQHHRSLAATDPALSKTLAAAMQFWCHCRGLPAAIAVPPPTQDPLLAATGLVDWLRKLGWPAQVMRTRQHAMGDFIWLEDARGTRFVVCQGEQPGLRVAYWDPCDGEHHWRALADLQTGSGDHQDLVVRPRPITMLQGPVHGRRRGLVPMSWPMRLLAWRSRHGE